MLLLPKCNHRSDLNSGFRHHSQVAGCLTSTQTAAQHLQHSSWICCFIQTVKRGLGTKDNHTECHKKTKQICICTLNIRLCVYFTNYLDTLLCSYYNMRILQLQLQFKPVFESLRSCRYWSVNNIICCVYWLKSLFNQDQRHLKRLSKT